MQPQALKLQATMLENEGPHCRIRKSDTSVTSKHPTQHPQTRVMVPKAPICSRELSEQNQVQIWHRKEKF